MKEHPLQFSIDVLEDNLALRQEWVERFKRVASLRCRQVVRRYNKAIKSHKKAIEILKEFK